MPGNSFPRMTESLHRRAWETKCEMDPPMATNIADLLTAVTSGPVLEPTDHRGVHKCGPTGT